MSRCIKKLKRETNKSIKIFEVKESYPEFEKKEKKDSNFLQIAQAIEDQHKNDQDIIDLIVDVIKDSSENVKRLREFKFGSDEFSLLHLGAKYCRIKLIGFLINNIQIDKDITTKHKQTVLQVLIDSNVIVKPKNEKALLEASEKKRRFKEAFDYLIAIGVDHNHQDDFGYTCVHYAALKNNYEAAINIINIKLINLSDEDKTGLTPLAIACKQGFDDIALLLIDHLRIDNLIDVNNKSLPLHLICKHKEEKYEVVKKILDKINAETKDNLILISYYYSDSIYDENFNLFLNDILKKVDFNGHLLLNILIENNHLKIIELLLKEYNRYIVDIEDPNENLFMHLAAKNGSPDLLKLLIKYNAFSVKLNKNNENALHIAAANNKFNFIKEYLAYEKTYAEKYLSEQQTDTDSEHAEVSVYKPSVKCFDKNNKTPLFTAVLNGHLKCVEVLATSEHIDLHSQDSLGNTVYHLCAELNNFECIRYLITRKEPKFQDALYIKNNNENTVLHTACEHGNLEVIRLVLSKINEGFSSTEAYLSSKNMDGYTCFHIACIKGYYNIIEYFLKDLKMKFLLEILDNDLNSCLHLAASYGHLSIVSLLIEYGIDIISKNRDGHTALELSFQKGYFEIIKLLVSSNSDLTIQEGTKNEYPLHTAAYEGSYEIVALLLSKGVPIETLNAERKNCLDVAISRDHREVIKVLLRDKNWHKLIRLHAFDDSATNEKLLVLPQEIKDSLMSQENPQLNILFEKKMYDVILIILDNCKNQDNYNFEKLDPPLKDIKKHPLMLMAQSGQETLLKHPTVQKLLGLKWRFLPRITFYSNILFYLVFLVVFTVYSLKLSNHINQNYKKIFNNSNSSVNTNQNFKMNKNFSFLIKNMYGSYDEFDDVSTKSFLSIFLLIIIVLSLVKNLLQGLLIDCLAYFNSIENIFEIATYVLAMISILSNDFSTKLTCGSVAILLSFIVFTFLIQKLKGFGLYVLAFRRTLHNSAKFFPIFLIVFIGFNLSFRLQTQFAISNKNVTEGGLILKTFIMVLGGIETGELGLAENTIVNFIIYFLFISIICVILVNLFVGIAVGEITTVLDEADVQQISMRIIFVLKVQESLKPFIKGPLTKKYLNLQFDSYTYDNEYKFIKLQDKIVRCLKNKFSSVEPSVELIDPQQRLEESMIELTRSTNSDLRSIRENLAHQIEEVEHKLSNSQQRIEDCLVEMTCRTTTNFESTKEDSSNSIGLVEVKLNDLTAQTFINFFDLRYLIKLGFGSIKQSFKSLFHNLELKFTTHLNRIETKIDELISINTTNQQLTNNQFLNEKTSLTQLFEQMNYVSNSLERLMEKFNELESFQTQHVERDSKINSLLVETIDKINEQNNIIANMPKSQNRIYEDELKESLVFQQSLKDTKKPDSMSPKIQKMVRDFDKKSSKEKLAKKDDFSPRSSKSNDGSPFSEATDDIGSSRSDVSKENTKIIKR